MWGKVSCLRKRHDGRNWASNHRPSDMKSNASTTTPPRPHNVSTTCAEVIVWVKANFLVYRREMTVFSPWTISIPNLLNETKYMAQWMIRRLKLVATKYYLKGVLLMVAYSFSCHWWPLFSFVSESRSQMKPGDISESENVRARQQLGTLRASAGTPRDTGRPKSDSRRKKEKLFTSRS